MSPVPIEQPPFLDPAPPPWAARAFATVLLALFVVAIAALILIQVPETVAAVFIVQPARGNDPVRTLHAGRIERVAVQDAAVVEAGQVLYLLTSEPVGDRAAERQTLDARISGGSAREVNERLRFESQQHADEQEQRRLEQKRDSLREMATLKQQELALAVDIRDRMKRALDAGVTSWMDSKKPQVDVDRLTGELQQIKSDTDDTTNRLSRLAFEMASNKAAFDELQRSIGEETVGLRARRQVLQNDPGERSGNSLAVTSPCAGTVVRLVVRNRNAMVAEGDVLAEVACSGERLRAELELPERGMALVRIGQSVKLQYDAFPYERYGVHFGSLRWVSPASTMGPRGSSFRALADLESDSVGVEGQRRPVLPGMTGRATVIVGRRSLASYVIEPLRQLRESLASGPPAQKPS